MKFGLRQEQVNQILRTVRSNSKVQEVIFFGSRARGDYRDNSDIDIAIKGKNLNSTEINMISSELDDLLLPYKIDLVYYETLKNRELRDKIDNEGVVLIPGTHDFKHPT